MTMETSAFMTSPLVRNSPTRKAVQMARVVRLKRLSEQVPTTTTPMRKKILRRETMSRNAILLESKRLNESQVEFSCPKCLKRFFHFNSLQVHLELHDDDTPVKPKVFEKTKFEESKDFLKNLHRELDEQVKQLKKRKCKQCGKRFKKKTSLKLHCFIRHSEVSNI